MITDPNHPRISQQPGLGTARFWGLVLAVVFLVYLPALQNGFVNWDDDTHLLQNRAVRGVSGEYLREQWTTTVNYTYIPLTITSFALEHHFFGFRPFIYHLDNILLHMLVVFLVMALGRRLGLDDKEAALAGLIFGLHPTHVESVAWVTERKDVLYASFYLLSILAYFRYAGSSARKWFWVSLACGFLSILSKPMALSLPLVLILCDWYMKRPFTARLLIEKVFYLAVMVPVVWMSFVWNSHLMEPGGDHSILIWIWCLVFYIWKFFVPADLVLYYGYPSPVNIGNLPYTFAVLGVIALLTAGVVFRKQRLFVFIVLFYFLGIFFLLRLKGINGIVADRFAYLPGAGFCMLVAVGIMRLVRLTQARQWSRYLVGACLFIVFAGMFAGTSQQCRVWRDGVSLWSNQIRHNPRVFTAVAHAKLAEAMMTQDSFRALLKRQSLPPNSRPPGQTQSDLKVLEEVFRNLDEAIRLAPQDATAYYLKARIFYDMGHFAAAAQILDRAVKADPGHADSYFLSGKIAISQGFPDQAVERFRRAVQAQPRYEYLYDEILNAYSRAILSGDHPEVYRAEREKVQRQLDLLKTAY